MGFCTHCGINIGDEKVCFACGTVNDFFIEKTDVSEQKESVIPDESLLLKTAEYFSFSFILDIITIQMIIYWYQQNNVVLFGGAESLTIDLYAIVPAILQAFYFQYKTSKNLVFTIRKHVNFYVFMPTIHFIVLIIGTNIFTNDVYLFNALNVVTLWGFFIGSFYIYLRIIGLYKDKEEKFKAERKLRFEEKRKKEFEKLMAVHYDKKE